MYSVAKFLRPIIIRSHYPKETHRSRFLFTSVARMGVQIDTIKEGDGATFPKTGQTVTCHYVLTLENGKQVDSSRDRGKPFQFKIGKGEVIKGWDQGVAKMSVGQRAKLSISSDLGYGASGAGGVIPPNANLIFDVELISLK